MAILLIFVAYHAVVTLVAEHAHECNPKKAFAELTVCVLRCDVLSTIRNLEIRRVRRQYDIDQLLQAALVDYAFMMAASSMSMSAMCLCHGMLDFQTCLPLMGVRLIRNPDWPLQFVRDAEQI